MNTSSFRAFRAPLPRAASAFALAMLLFALCSQPGFAAPAAKPIEKPADPRIPISAETTPGDSNSIFQINAPGSYYLTDNVTGVAGKNGIEINSSNVTVDLNGFALLGNALARDGITVDVPNFIENVAVHNGTVTGWGQTGVRLSKADTAVVEKVQASRNLESGIFVGSSGTVRDCTASYNVFTGIGTESDSVFDGCTATGNGGMGFSLSSGSARGCSAESNWVGFGSSSASIVDSTANHNRLAGFVVANGGIVKNSSAQYNDGWGIRAGSSSTVQSCSARFNGEGGIDVDGAVVTGNTIQAQSATATKTPGIRVQSRGAYIAENQVSFGTIGIHIATGNAHRIEANNLSGNDVGLKVDSTANIVVHNTARSTQKNYQIIAGNRVGTIVVPALAGAIDGNSGGGSGTTDPWSNIAY